MSNEHRNQTVRCPVCKTEVMKWKNEFTTKRVTLRRNE